MPFRILCKAALNIRSSAILFQIYVETEGEIMNIKFK
jgi:hypothetical protein